MLCAVVDRHAVPVAAVAVVWTLTFPGVSGAIVGVCRPEQLDGWPSAGTLDLTDKDLTEIAEAAQRLGAGHGPIRPVTIR